MAWRATAAAKIAWCIADMSRLRPWACRPSAVTLGKRSNSISVRNRGPRVTAVRFSPTTVSVRETVISPASAQNQPASLLNDRDGVEPIDSFTERAGFIRDLLGGRRRNRAGDGAFPGKSVAAAKT